jgi:two-component system, NarL family, response regulator DegU
MNRIRLALVDDQKLFRQSLSVLLGGIPQYELVFEAENGIECLDKLKTTAQKPHVILMDMEMPEMDGIELSTHLQNTFPEIKRIILSVFAKERLIARMIEAGASGYLLKNCGKDELCSAIEDVFARGFYMNAEVMKAIQNKSNYKSNVLKNLHNIPIELTARETEILQCICKEYSNQEIAEKLFISIRTVEGHRTNLLLKTGCKNTAGLALFAVKYKIFEVVF